ncbi:MAG: hypothetical protein H6858_03900 [Rhodospirillales bacterium]|nr:hypothetical protein [Alphaproteobacteria bacterium]MCB1839586.1 hypothetical protein [Alphaproteobacteria bacterium]MCB9976729.1 hypothetical protein [Rhodospirillales bacterium]
MEMRNLFAIPLLVFMALLVAFPASAEAQKPKTDSCNVSEKICILSQIQEQAQTLESKTERDQTYRELAKAYARSNKIDEAVALIPKIQTPDTQAMTIRGIGMELAALNLPKDRQDAVFKTLRTEAEKIKHPPSYAIALTYIAMSQAFAGDDEGAWKTASEMQNDSLRHKAFGETAEIQAEKGEYEKAKTSLTRIGDPSYQNKAYRTVSKILADKGLYEESYDAALQIANPYLKALALQYLVDKQDGEHPPGERIPANEQE